MVHLHIKCPCQSYNHQFFHERGFERVPGIYFAAPPLLAILVLCLEMLSLCSELY